MPSGYMNCSGLARFSDSVDRYEFNEYCASPWSVMQPIHNLWRFRYPTILRTASAKRSEMGISTTFHSASVCRDAIKAAAMVFRSTLCAGLAPESLSTDDRRLTDSTPEECFAQPACRSCRPTRPPSLRSLCKELRKTRVWRPGVLRSDSQTFDNFSKSQFAAGFKFFAEHADEHSFDFSPMGQNDTIPGRKNAYFGVSGTSQKTRPADVDAADSESVSVVGGLLAGLLGLRRMDGHDFPIPKVRFHFR